MRDPAPASAATASSAVAITPNEAMPCPTPRGGPRSARAR